MVVIFGLTTLHSQENHETEQGHSNQIPALFPPALPAPRPNNNSVVLSHSHLLRQENKKDLVPVRSPASDAATNPPSIIIVSSSLLVLIRLHHRSGLGMESAAGLSLFLRLKN